MTNKNQQQDAIHSSASLETLESAILPHCSENVLRQAIAPIRELLEIILVFHDGNVNSAIRWSETPNSAFGGEKPITLMAHGKWEELKRKWMAFEHVYGS